MNQGRSQDFVWRPIKASKVWRGLGRATTTFKLSTE